MDTSAIIGAGVASAIAAVVTSRLGAAGTLLGAALTTMIITGGAAVLKSYMDTASSRVRRAPEGSTQSSSGSAEPSGSQMQNAFRWFSHLSPDRRRSIFTKAIPAVVLALVVGFGIITLVELVAGSSYTCLIWVDSCQTSTQPSVLGGGEGVIPGEQSPVQPQVPDAPAE